jgi:hypothetical protein
MLLLMQQMFRRRHSQLPIKIGQQIAWHHWHSATLSSREMAEQCRQHVMRLGRDCLASLKPSAPLPVKTGPR